MMIRLLQKLCVVSIFLSAVLWLNYFNSDHPNINNELHNSSDAIKIDCYNHARNSNTLPELPETVAPNSGIFFLETSCHSTPGVHLNVRQACAVESAAKMNPGKDVYVLFPGPVMDDAAALSPIVQQLLLYPNVRLRHIDMTHYFHQTPLQEWYESGQLRTSAFPLSHSSDVLRFLTLWKFGGIYLDLDVVVIKSLSNLVNFAGAQEEDPVEVNGAVLSFSHDGEGHEMATQVLRDLRHDFRGHLWAYNGPDAITRLLKSVCSTKMLKVMTPESCKGFTIFPVNVFYPIHYWEWKLYFNTTHSDETLSLLNSSHVIHVWNYLSWKAKVTVGSRQPYSVIASQFCPRVYKHAGNFF